MTPATVAAFAFAPAMVVAPGSGAALVTVIGTVGAIYVIRRGGRFMSRAGAAIAGAALLWTLLKAMPPGAAGFELWLRLLLLSLAGLGVIGLFRHLSDPEQRHASIGLAAGISVALVLLWLDAPDRLGWRADAAWGGSPAMGETVLAVVLWPAVTRLYRIGWRWLAGALAVAGIATLLGLGPPEARLACAFGAGALLFGLIGGGVAVRLSAGIVALAILVVPVAVSDDLPATLWGDGLGATAEQTPGQVTTPRPAHFAIHGVARELGIPALVLLAGACVVMLTGGLARRCPRPQAGARLAVFSAAAAPMTISVGLWPDPWFATLWLASALVAPSVRDPVPPAVGAG